jgi:3-oxoacyl-[acyl-carrier-protein] synthase III
MMGLSGKAAIVGAAESDAIGILPGKSTLQLVGEASLNAVEDAGLSIRDIDAVFTAG